MKQKEKIFSSLLVAIVAGFIYYTFADVETIKSLPQFAYKIFISSDKEDNSSAALNAGVYVSSLKDKKSDFPEDELKKDLFNEEIIVSSADLSNPSSLAYVFSNVSRVFPYVSIPDFVPEADRVVYRKSERKFRDKKDDFAVYTEFEYPDDDIIHLISYDDETCSDSDRVRIHIRMKSLDSMNVHLDRAMEKLNKSLESLNDKIAEHNFDIDIPDLKPEDFEFNFKFDMEEFREDMKEFQKDMKDFKLDMKELEGNVEMFQFDSKELEENMKELKENLKELQENLNEMKHESKKDMKKFKTKRIDS